MVTFSDRRNKTPDKYHPVRAYGERDWGFHIFLPRCPSHTFVHYRLLLFSSLAAGQTLYLYSHRGEETEGSERVGGQKTGVFRVMFTAIIQKGTPQRPHSPPLFLVTTSSRGKTGYPLTQKPLVVHKWEKASRRRRRRALSALEIDLLLIIHFGSSEGIPHARNLKNTNGIFSEHFFPALNWFFLENHSISPLTKFFLSGPPPPCPLLATQPPSA